ncbi:MAG: CoA transferase [Dehalococcoidia bacterium]|jgi:benzylsuccinate CoA-transferase BbsF subunit|nr:CoA transferase [Dehalococcoidia bacterium]MDP7469263.1 CoA transferase [Dehalococcoidia bacterium]
MENGQALEGVKVLDFTWWGAGPIFTKYLSDFGATVVKVESHKRLDLVRLSEPYRDGKVGTDTSAMFLQLNTSKLGITVNLSVPKGKELILKLVEWADVVADNFSAGFMQRAGLGYEELRKVKPDIIMLSSSCLGQTGVYSDLRGHALVGAALSGHFHLTGYPDGEPTTPASIGVADVFQPMLSAAAVLAALEHRRRTGEGQYIDLAQVEAMNHYMAPALLDMQANDSTPHRDGNHHPQAAPHGVFQCKGDDRWVAIAVFTQDEWQGLCQAMGDPQWCREERFATLAGRKQNEDVLERLIAEWSQTQVAEEAMEHLQRHGVAAGVVQNPRDILESDPQVQARDLFPVMHHPVIGDCIHPTSGAQLSRTPSRIETSPLLGEHNEKVFCQFLGMSSEEFASLVSEQVIY